MNIIQVMRTLPRLMDDALAARLRVTPAVVLMGARQTGRSPLVGQLVPGKRRYRSFDEGQCDPDPLSEIRLAVDHDRQRGRFLLAGSANPFPTRQVSGSLAAAVLAVPWRGVP